MEHTTWFIRNNRQGNSREVKEKVEKSSLIPSWPPKSIVSHCLLLAKSSKRSWHQSAIIATGNRDSFQLQNGKKRYKFMDKENREMRRY